MEETTVNVNLPARPMWQELLLSALSLTGVLLMVWWTLPQQERQMIRLSALSRAHRCLAALAWREGRAGMSDELAGRDPAARYGMAAWLGRIRDELERSARQ